MKKLAAILCIGSLIFVLSPLTLFLSVPAKPGFLVVKTSPPDSDVSLRAHMGGRQHQDRDLLGRGWEPIPIDRLPLDSPSRSLTFLIDRAGFQERELTVSGDEELRQLQKSGIAPVDGAVLELEEDTRGYLRLKIEKRWRALVLCLLSGAVWLALLRREQVEMKRRTGLDRFQAGDVTHRFLEVDVGEYRVTEYIGCGGMADVYKAVPRHMINSEKRAHHEVAVKFFKDTDPGKVDKVYSELQIAQKIQHPNVVKIYEEGGLPTGSGNVIPYLVMEYIPGQTLWELGIERGNGRPYLPWAQLSKYLEPVAAALQHAHSLGVIHRDVTPNNIMITPDGGVKVLDFGLSKTLDRTGSAANTMTLGTPYYLSPEQYRQEDVDGRTDQFALGAIVYYFLTGASPYGSDDRQIQQNLEEQKITLSLLEKNPECPPEARAVVAKMLAPSPSERYGSIAEAFAELKLAFAKSC